MYGIPMCQTMHAPLLLQVLLGACAGGSESGLTQELVGEWVAIVPPEQQAQKVGGVDKQQREKIGGTLGGGGIEGRAYMEGRGEGEGRRALFYFSHPQLLTLGRRGCLSLGAGSLWADAAK